MKIRISKSFVVLSLVVVLIFASICNAFALETDIKQNSKQITFYSEGASVRVTDNENMAQMRFQIVLERSDANFDKWFDGTKAKAGVETGVICMLYEEYKSYVTEQCPLQLSTISKLNAAKTITTNNWVSGKNRIVSYAYLNASDVPAANGKTPYNQMMVARGYIKYGAYVIYTDTVIASMSDIAYKSQNKSVTSLNAKEKAIVKSTYMKNHAVHIIPLTGTEKVDTYQYGTPFSSITNDLLFTDEQRTQVFSDSYVTDDVILYSAKSDEYNLGLDKLNGISYDKKTNSINVLGNTQINVSDDWFSAKVTGIEGVKNFELSVTYGGMLQYTSNNADGYIGIGLKNADGKQVYFSLMESGKNVYKALTMGAYATENGWTKQKVAEDVTITLRRIENQYIMSYGEESWVIDSSEIEKVFSTTSVIDLRFFACMTKGITIKEWNFVSLDKDSKVVTKGLNYYAMGTDNEMDYGAYKFENSKGDWSSNLKNATEQKDFVVSWNMSSDIKANNAGGSVGIRLTNPKTAKSVCFAVQHAYYNAGRAYIYSDTINNVKGNLRSYSENGFSSKQWSIKLIRKAGAYYLTLNGERLWVGKETCMLNEVMIGDILGENVNVGFETHDWNVQNATWSFSTDESVINAAIPDVTIDDGLAFYPMGSVSQLNPEGYSVQNNQINVTDDWFSAQVLEANRIKDFELSVTYSGMTNYKTNEDSGRVGISFKNDDGKILYFDLYELNDSEYYARLFKAFLKENGKTNQSVTEDVTVKFRRVGQKYTITYGTQEWSFYSGELSNASGSMNDQFEITEIHDLRFYAAITHGITIKDWQFTNLDGAPKKITDGLSFYAAGTDSAMASGAYSVTDNNEIKVSKSEDWFTARVVEAAGVNDFELSVTFKGVPNNGAMLGMSFKNSEGKLQSFLIVKNGSNFVPNLKSTYLYSNESKKIAVSGDEITVKLKRTGTDYTLTYGNEEWKFSAADKLDSNNTFESVFSTSSISDLRFCAYMTGGITVKAWTFTNLDAEVAIDEGLNFYAAGTNNVMDPQAYKITRTNKIVVYDDWFTARLAKVKDVSDFELSVTFNGMPNNGAMLGMSCKNEAGVLQSFMVDKIDDKTYVPNLRSAYVFTKSQELTSSEPIEEITVKLKRVGEKYILSYGTMKWIFNASDKLNGTNTFESQFATTKISDLRIIAYMTGEVTIKSWSFTTEVEDEVTPVDNGLNFYAAGTTNAMIPGAYSITKENQIKVNDDWFTAQVAAADEISDFELSATFKGVPNDGAMLGMSFKNKQDKTQSFMIVKNGSNYVPNLKTTYIFANNSKKINVAGDEITVKLKKIGKNYTFTYGDDEWVFNSSDKLDGNNTFESMFATSDIKDLRFFAYVTGGIVVKSWSFTNLDVPIASGLTFHPAEYNDPLSTDAYEITESNKIKILDKEISDWFTAKVTEASSGINDFELSVTFKGIVSENAMLGVYCVNSDGVLETFRIQKDSKGHYVPQLGTSYSYTNTAKKISSTGDEITVSLRRVGSNYTFSYGSAVWEFDATDNINGNGTLESQFATNQIKDLRILAYITGGIKIKSWSFTNLDK